MGDRLTPTIDERLGRIEKILKDQKMHEPDCPARRIQKLNAQGGMYYYPRDCECWLKEE